MKRKIYILTFLLSLFSATVFSQSLSIIRNSVIVPNNTTVAFDFDTVTVVHDYEDFDIRNNSNTELQVWVKKVYLNVCPGNENSICWGQCSFEFLLGPVSIAANTTISSEFSFHYNPMGQTGGSNIRYVFFVDHNQTDSVCFNVKFRHPYDVGVNEIYKNYLFTNAFPNPASNIATINYSYSSEVNNANIVVADLLGKVVKNIPLSSKQGKVTINTIDITDGIYLYSLQLNGRIVSTRKLIVNH